MSHNPNTVKSQDDLPTTNDGKRSSDVVLSAVEKCERLQKQLDIAVWALNSIKHGERTIKDDKGNLQYIESYALEKIEELNK